MKMRLVLVLFVVAIAIVALTPSKASAGWGWWGGPGVNIYVGPPIHIMAITATDTGPTPITAITVIARMAITATVAMAGMALDTDTGGAEPIAGGIERLLWRCAASFLWSLQVTLVQVGRSSRYGAGTRPPESRP